MFKHLATRHKLYVSFPLIILSILLVGWIAYSSNTNLTKCKQDMQSGYSLMRVSDEAAATQAHMLALLLGGNKQALLGDLAVTSKELTQIVSSLRRTNQLKPSELSELDRLTADFLAGSETFVATLQAGRLANAQEIAMAQELPRMNKIRALCQQRSEPYMQSIDDKTDWNPWIAFISLMSLALTISCYFILRDEIARPLQELTAASERLAAGDLGVRLPDSDRNDEVGTVVRAYSSMVASLHNISEAAQRVAQGDLRVNVKPRSESDALGKAFASMVENMASATSQIKSAVDVLSTAVNNIMASVAESASGATQTATAVTETTTTVEEVRQTSHVANQKAKNVAESAQKSAQISNMGRKSTEETIQGMKRIREQMDLIADSMVRLSEKSQSIVEIIATVDDLAQQSNLLAVNASIEAAKAGDLGRGFAVVAQEVKSMSDQSKQATAQVRKILSEIQQATSSAAMATELGSRAVDAAVTQSNQAGEAISALASSVVDSANAAAQIAVSSQQQLAGVDQVATAMMGIKDATAQNLIAIRHVEEAAHTLQELGGTLKVLTQRYQL